MRRPTLLLIAPLLLALACSRGPAPSDGPPAIRLADGTVEVTGLPSSTLDALTKTPLSDDQWGRVLRVAVSADAPPMLGRYAVEGGTVRFTPAFPLDPGRSYQATFDGTPVDATGAPRVTASLGLPAVATEPTTVVAQVYPSGDTIPANILRMYVEFSAEMSRKSGVSYLTLLDEKGEAIPGAVLPLDYEFWSPDHRRFTVFYDPGRVKQGILPNRQMGRAFRPGEKVTLVVSRDWTDANGQPLREAHRRTFTVLPPDEAPLDPAGWRVTAPASGGTTPVVVTFPKPLDHSLLQRALGVRRNGQPVEGMVSTGAGEREWRFTPAKGWAAGHYEVIALDILEDVAGNQVGRAFEVDNFDSVDKDPDPKTVTLPFDVR